MRISSVVLTLLFLSFSVAAEIQVYDFDSEEQRQSFMNLSSELRCPKCQNQNLADSNSEIADIMLDVIAEEVQGGKGEEEIKAMMVDRYGDFVLYKPPVKTETLILWWAPIIVVGIIFIVFIGIVVKRSGNIADDGDDDPVEIEANILEENTKK